jgi:hypothetical protein
MKLLEPWEPLTPEHLDELAEELRAIGWRQSRAGDQDVIAAATGIVRGLAKHLRAKPLAAGQPDNLTSLDV